MITQRSTGHSRLRHTATLVVVVSFILSVTNAQGFADSPEPPPNDPGKRRQYIPSPGFEPAFGGPLIGPAGPPPPAAGGQCPGGPSLPIECDPKRPWPQCPPQSYCYATNSVDIGPYFCCPIWSTYGAAWRPATPFYNYVPPPPPNWPPSVARVAAAWPAGAVGLPPVRKSKKEPRYHDGVEGPPGEDQKQMIAAMNDWLKRQQDEADALGSGLEPPHTL